MRMSTRIIKTRDESGHEVINLSTWYPALTHYTVFHSEAGTSVLLWYEWAHSTACRVHTAKTRCCQYSKGWKRSCINGCKKHTCSVIVSLIQVFLRLAHILFNLHIHFSAQLLLGAATCEDQRREAKDSRRQARKCAKQHIIGNMDSAGRVGPYLLNCFDLFTDFCTTGVQTSTK